MVVTKIVDSRVLPCSDRGVFFFCNQPVLAHLRVSSNTDSQGHQRDMRLGSELSAHYVGTMTGGKNGVKGASCAFLTCI